MTRTRVGIIGGGLAGLSAAAYLLKDGGNTHFDVTVLESGSCFGGQAASWYDRDGDPVETGIHLDFPWYANKWQMYEDIGAPLKLVETDGNYYICNGKTGTIDTLYAGTSVLKTLYGVAAFPGLSVAERMKVGKLFWSLMRMSDTEAESYDTLTVPEFLRMRGATAAMQSQLALEPVTIQGLYPDQASAASFIKFLRTMYDCLGTKNPAFFTKPTGEALIDPLLKYIKMHGGHLYRSTPVQGVTILPNPQERDSIVVSITQRSHRFDRVILAVPGHKVPSLVPRKYHEGSLAKLHELRSANIITLTLWYSEWDILPDHNVYISNRDGVLFDAVTDKMHHWNFSSGSVVQVLIDAAHDVKDWSDEALYAQSLKDLARYFPAARKYKPYKHNIIRHRSVYSETRPGYWNAVPKTHTTPMPNVLVAGDYTAGLYHYGMESAVISGKEVANLLRGECDLPQHPMAFPRMLPLYKK